MRNSGGAVGGFWLLTISLWLISPLPSAQAGERGVVAGVYRCWSQNVGGAGRRCTGPPLILHADGTYEISSERGTYSITGDQVVLSESRIRGPGRLSGGNQVIFEYTYQGLQHTVIYLRQEAQAPPPANPRDQSGGGDRVPVDITIRFSPSDGSAAWINGAALISEGGIGVAEALARTDGRHTVRVSFRAVETGQTYQLMVSSGLERRAIGTINLRSATGPVMLTLDVPEPAVDRDRPTPPLLGGGYVPPPSGPPPAVSPEGTTGNTQPSAIAPEAPPCNPKIPHYAQRGCRD